jgi:type IV secretion system protein VirB1
MESATFLSLVLTCAPQVHADTARALVATESSFNPWAIGVVGGQLERQPRSRAEALATANALKAGGWNFSVGLAQINVRNFTQLGLTLEDAFEACSNLAAMQTVLTKCFDKAGISGEGAQQALRQALSCYYSGNFTTGFTHGYVRKVVTAAARASLPSPASSKEKT